MAPKQWDSQNVWGGGGGQSKIHFQIGFIQKCNRKGLPQAKISDQNV